MCVRVLPLTLRCSLSVLKSCQLDPLQSTAMHCLQLDTLTVAHYSQMSSDLKLRCFVWVGLNDTVFINSLYKPAATTGGEKAGMQLTNWHSDLLCKRKQQFWFWHPCFAFIKAVKYEYCNVIILFWCFNVVSHIRESEVVSFSDNLDLNSSPQGEVVSFQTAGFHGCTVTCDTTSKAF